MDGVDVQFSTEWVDGPSGEDSVPIYTVTIEGVPTSCRNEAEFGAAVREAILALIEDLEAKNELHPAEETTARKFGD
jgi:hypothetical protein